MKPDSSKRAILVPFLKWAGGKRWLVANHPELFPKKYNRYIEPFLGSGAVYFHLNPKKAILSDMNSELIQSYQQIRDNWESLNEILTKFDSLHSKEFYYRIRSTAFEDPVDRAARFIYLNRTCWNGLYRVNKQGHFNVPIGTKTNVILSSDDFSKCSKLLSNAKILSSDFEVVINMAKKGDFLFIDPPYTVKHNFNGFVKYNDSIFSWDDQIRLRDSIKRAVTRGAKVLLTNADHKSVKDLYSGIGAKISLNRHSVISGKPSARGKYSELVVKCFND